MANSNGRQNKIARAGFVRSEFLVFPGAVRFGAGLRPGPFMRASTSDNGSDLPRSRSVARPFALADELPVPLDIDQLNFFLRGVQPKRARRDPAWPPLTKGGRFDSALMAWIGTRRLG